MKNRFAILGLHLSIFLAFVYGYEYYIFPIFEYMGYVFEPNEAKWYAALACVTAGSLLTPIDQEKPSTLFYQMILTFVLIPMLVLFHAEDKPWLYMGQVFAAYLGSLFVARFLRIRAPRFDMISSSQLLTLLFACSLACVVAILAMGGAQYLNFDISKVYDFRDEASDNLPGIFSYISPLVGKVFVPMAFVLALKLRKYVSAACIFLISILLYGLTANKGPLVYPFFIFFVYVFCSVKNSIAKFNVAILLGLLISMFDFFLKLEYDYDFLGWTGSVFMRRAFILPSEINFMYFDFFSKNEFVLFSNSKISFGLLDFNYDLDIPYLIGREYFNNVATSANTGWFGSGY
ncbi:MAG: hypothetical protein RSF79_23905, partial [Janthinobacterium sp.]